MSILSVFAGVGPQPSPNDPLVSADDFAEWCGLGDGTAASLTSLQQRRIQTALEISSAAIRNGRRIFSAVSDESVYVDGSDRPSVLTLRDRLPVTDVSQVQEMRISDTDYSTVDPLNYDWDEYGIITLNGRGQVVWTPRRRGVIVTYSHGYSVLPREVAGICLAYAKRLFDDPQGQGIIAQQLGDARVEYEPGGGLWPYEKEQLRQYEVER